jgi:hypothetical protein
VPPDTVTEKMVLFPTTMEDGFAMKLEIEGRLAFLISVRFA